MVYSLVGTGFAPFSLIKITYLLYWCVLYSLTSKSSCTQQSGVLNSHYFVSTCFNQAICKFSIFWRNHFNLFIDSVMGLLSKKN